MGCEATKYSLEQGNLHSETDGKNQGLRRRRSTGEWMSGKFCVGWGEADITPDGRTVELNGQYYQRVATGIHSRLNTTALLLEKGEETSVLVSIDNVGVPADFVKRLQRSAAGLVAHLSPERVTVNAIHTHNAPALSQGREWWTPRAGAISCEEYRDIVEQKILDALRAAVSNKRECGIASVLDFARVGHCRRAVYADGSAEMYGNTGRADFVGMEGGEDSGVDVMFFVDADRKPVGAIVNLACPSQVMEATYKVSSDFMGALRGKLKQEFGPDFALMPQISAAGCQSPRDLSRNYRGEVDFWGESGVEEISERLLGAVRRAWKRTAGRFRYDPEFAHVGRTLLLPLRRVSEQEYLAAKRELAELEAKQSSAEAFKEFCAEVHAHEEILGRPGPYDDKTRHFVEIRNREAVVKRYETRNSSPELAVDLQVMRLGNAVFATNPFELFLEFGQRMKARSKAGQTFLIQLANGYEGYLPSPRAEQFGGYGGLIVNGKIGSEGGSILVDETVKIIGELFDENRTIPAGD